MKKMKKNETIALNDNLTCSFEIKRIGQKLPAFSDNVEVQVSLYLPHLNDTLHPDIEFGYNIKIFNEDLIKRWGEIHRNKNNDTVSRMKTEKFDAVTWAEAFDRAEKYVLSEIKKITVRLEKRKQALVEAEKVVETEKVFDWRK